MIDDVQQNETVKAVVESKLMFCSDHNLLMYSKFVMTISNNKQRSNLQFKVEKVNFSDSNSEDDSDENDLSDIENSISQFFSMQFFH